MTYSQAIILGLVEGITEYLPVSSTGHLILVDAFLGFRGNSALSQSQMDAIDAFEIVIQGGAILAVIFAYWPKVKNMFRGLIGQNSDGKKLLFNVVAAFLPAATIGFVLHKIIKKYLQQEWPAVFALAIGGIVMILFEKSQLAKTRKISGLDVSQLTIKGAVIIGLLQCIAMWPGTSRSMMTILGGILVGLTPAAAAEFSFLLGLPTLLAATGFKAIKHGPELVAHIGFDTMAVGLVVAAISAFICVRGFISWLTKFGLAPFGYYRIVLSVVVAVYLLTTQSQ
ncbi:MAG: undecaprenyl-diphosphate phosphatase [Proteobacteria bacterium]|nr:undecaprenyl-diphosphate phosphatase [Pseudomonadota bacterium]